MSDAADDEADAVVDPSLFFALIQPKGDPSIINPFGSVVVSIVSFPLAHIFNMTYSLSSYWMLLWVVCRVTALL